jgi:hypothetical protein
MTTDPQDLGCDLCEAESPQVLHLSARCHRSAPLKFHLEDDVLVVSCYIPECGREVARFKVVTE